QCIDLAIGDVEAAQLVERQLVPRAQPQDLPLGERIEPLALVDVIVGRGPAAGMTGRVAAFVAFHDPLSRRSSTTARPGSTSNFARASPVIANNTSSGGRATCTRQGAASLAGTGPRARTSSRFAWGCRGEAHAIPGMRN